jgi:starvation-inducible DNA-binding protein
MAVNAFGHDQAGALDGALAYLLDLGLLARHAHWNVVGSRFGSVHELLGESAGVARSDDEREADNG